MISNFHAVEAIDAIHINDIFLFQLLNYSQFVFYSLFSFVYFIHFLPHYTVHSTDFFFLREFSLHCICNISISFVTHLSNLQNNKNNLCRVIPYSAIFFRHTATVRNFFSSALYYIYSMRTAIFIVCITFCV